MRNRLAALMAEQSIKEGRRVDIREIAEETGISRTTLYKYVNQDATHFSGKVLETLCKHFNVPLERLLYIEPDTGETH